MDDELLVLGHRSGTAQQRGMLSGLVSTGLAKNNASGDQPRGKLVERGKVRITDAGRYALGDED
jgi:hypothetical protein